ncbi:MULTISPECIES: Nif11-like leader peptide family natural product precursor [Planktothricoides]|uniref:Nif11-like leader peptide family natural product n=2 Tax=Planktothricoides raciborskii TaxID=132608 RepID=A0AAU8J9J5_9CYAN|nr:MULTISPECIES: Nif11-like leader peptide family natural product precursor [Planktothricoides]KOR35337.1 bacteriocin [Planktothricoides sp. SR001]MBD2547053.1 Nif11-like leader peptide family natural product precursor [Planktothricoides raciborskii FACHB-1370]MBD2585583.1 Nif11-like leader peptide family natural product precursor [Planktothricoides raciborskii FACHB-1261]
MAVEEVVRLFRTVQQYPEIKEKLNSAPNLETLVQMAGEMGYSFTVEEWKQATRFEVEELKSKLSEIPGI